MKAIIWSAKKEFTHGPASLLRATTRARRDLRACETRARGPTRGYT
jgi:hypothetical protein